MTDSVPPAEEAEGPRPTPGREFRKRFRKTYIRDLSRGYFVELRKLSLTGEILRGTLPNHVLKHVVFEETPMFPGLGDEDADLGEETQKRKRQYTGYLPILARGFVKPRFIIDREVDEDNDDEIGPDDLNFVEMSNAFYYIAKEVVPPESSAPFLSREDDDVGVGPIGRDSETLSEPEPESVLEPA